MTSVSRVGTWARCIMGLGVALGLIACGAENPGTPEEVARNRERSTSQVSLAQEQGPALGEGDLGLGVKLTGKDGWVVDAVVPGSPAERAGVLEGDRVLHLGAFQAAALKAENDPELQNVLRAGSVKVAVERGGESLELEVRPGLLKDLFPALYGGKQSSQYVCYWACMPTQWPYFCYNEAKYALSCGTCLTCISL